MFGERVVLPEGGRFEIRLDRALRYRLRFFRDRSLLVEYLGDGAKHLRRVRGKESVYQFKSVEQLRYDFERDAEDARSRG